MKKVVTCSQMKLLDHGTIHNMHVPSLVLMERAALATAEEIRKYLRRDPEISGKEKRFWKFEKRTDSDRLRIWQ